ncbi:MAG: type I 3-dehydroquinate dehydratase [Candidatus Binatia bacterium]|nr:type I 3-dehydroquinate dehydratase [Candidatus Binatia bacterium]
MHDDVAAVRRAVRPGVDILELRIDQFAAHDPAHVAGIAATLRRLRRPLLATVRRAEEGGAQRLADETRCELWRAVLPHVAAIDVELQSAREFAPLLDEARAQGCRVLLSYHDFERTPTAQTLATLFRRARALGADAVKLALQAQQPDDVWRLAAFTWEHREFPVITMCMGPLGPLSRLSLPLCGSRWVYTSLQPKYGQIPLRRLLADLRFYFP